MQEMTGIVELSVLIFCIYSIIIIFFDFVYFDEIYLIQHSNNTLVQFCKFINFVIICFNSVRLTLDEDITWKQVCRVLNTIIELVRILIFLSSYCVEVNRNKYLIMFHFTICLFNVKFSTV